MRNAAYLLLLLPCLLSLAPGTKAQINQEKASRTDHLTVFMIGDSTMANKPVIPANPERGWGQMLPLYFRNNVRIDNHAMNGRSSKSFLAEGRWKAVLQRVTAGDYVIIQFGHNDEKTNNSGRVTEPFGSFKENLAKYVSDTREKGGLPILATPIARRRFDKEGRFFDTHGDYPAAVRQLAEEMKVPLLDLHARTTDLLKQLGPELSLNMFNHTARGEYAMYPEGLKDDTHLNSIGAARVCDLAVAELEGKVPGLANYLKREP